ncbi:MAG: cytochrome c [Acidimicrobiia bacterium]|nr:cytochrome c [Acidimicrobiia bacterium]
MAHGFRRRDGSRHGYTVLGSADHRPGRDPAGETGARPGSRTGGRGLIEQYGGIPMTDRSRRRSIRLCMGLGITALLAAPALALAQEGDVDAGRDKAALCAACHGPNGISSNPLWPNLAGQHEAYLAKQIRDFRDGVREDISMQPFVAQLSEQDIADLAAFYASLPAGG